MAQSELSLLVDFGSTYTKVVAVDLAKEEVVAVVQSPSTVDSDIMIGLEKALEKLRAVPGQKDLHIEHKLAASSAAGGLRMIAIALVPQLTAEAAKQTALGAGAKVLHVFSFLLRPKTPSYYVDERYLMYAAGLLNLVAPDSVLRIMKKSMKSV